MPTTTGTNQTTTRGQQVESVVLVLIVIAVGTAAGAASFTHVKDWTLHNSPPGTGAWFGWANAVISELVPIASLLTIRRRKRTGGPILYPLMLLIAAAGLSLAAQLGVAVGHVGPSGWLLSAVPALAFMALVKLVLAPVKTTTGTPDADTTPTTPTITPATVDETISDAPAMPAVIESSPTPVSEPVFAPDVPRHLIPTARFAMVQHHRATGEAITADELATRMSITPHIAGQLLTAIDPPATPARVNGTRLPTTG